MYNLLMAKKSSFSDIDIRHWLLVAIVVAFAATNALWYEAYEALDSVNAAQTEDIANLQTQINTYHR
jgi:predicted outer membrane lipoprotein